MSSILPYVPVSPNALTAPATTLPLLSPKNSVVLATTVPLASNTYWGGNNGVGASLTGLAGAGVAVIDGINALVGMRVLVKNEANPAHNGIYNVTSQDYVNGSYVLTRASDFDEPIEIPGAFVPVMQGISNAGHAYVVSGAGPFTIGQTPINFLSVQSARTALTGDRTFYVRSDGSDSNDGSQNNSANAFVTPQHAIDVVKQTVDLAGHSVTIQIADAIGAYSGNIAVVGPFVGGGQVTLQGNLTVPANVILGTLSLQNGASLNVAGFTTSAITVTEQSRLFFTGKMKFQTNIGGRHIQVLTGGYVNVLGNSYEIAGNAAYHWIVYEGGMLICQSNTITLTGTPAFATDFAEVDHGGWIICNAITFVNTATGKRWDASTNGIIETFGSGATYLPGNVNGGPVATQGQYL